MNERVDNIIHDLEIDGLDADQIRERVWEMEDFKSITSEESTYILNKLGA